jgi:hypothetical protein
MAADLQGQFAAGANVNFQQRVAAAMRAVAVTVYTENPTTTGHAARAAYALQVVQNPPLGMVTTNQFGTTDPDKLVYAWASLLASQGLDNGSTDAAIQAQIAADWNAMAGA